MKKTLFAAQVFGLLAMFPLIVILEMNHAKPGSSENNNPSAVTRTMEKTIIGLPAKATDKIANEVFIVTLEKLMEQAY